MATSNRDRIGGMFELLAPALDEFITRSVASALNKGTDWTVFVQLKDESKGIDGKEYSRLDPQVQLRMLTENIPAGLRKGWYPFDDAIGRVGQGYTKELREYRNDWAHNKPFSDDDAYRCLDTAERLLALVGAASVADDVKSIRLGLRRAERGEGRPQGADVGGRYTGVDGAASLARGAGPPRRCRDRELPGRGVRGRPLQGVGD